MRIQPFVEGHGEVQAVPVLLRRFQEQSGIYPMEILRPVRSPRSDFLDEIRLRNLIRRTLIQRPCEALLILLDGDDDCPRELAPRIENWTSAEAGGIPSAAVILQREYESWLLASLEALRGVRGIRTDATSVSDPESIRGAKERLKANMLGAYAPASDQAALTALFNMEAAYRACRSFRRMVSAFGKIARGAGAALSDWPPESWCVPRGPHHRRQ